MGCKSTKSTSSPQKCDGKNSKKIVIGYWQIRGRGQAARFLATYLKLDWENKFYQTPEQWGTDKPNLPTLFPNLPFVQYDPEKAFVTENEAVLQWLCIKGNQPKMAVPSTSDEQVMLQQTNGVVTDLFNTVCGAGLKPDYASTYREDFKNKISPMLKKLNQHLDGKQWLAGSQITYADFKLAEIFDLILSVGPSDFEEFQNCQKYHKQFFELSQIKAYMESEESPVKQLVFSPPFMSDFGSKVIA